MKFKKILFGMVIATVMAMAFAPVIMSGRAEEQINNDFKIDPSSAANVAYNGYKEKHEYSNDKIEWEFESSKNYIDITVYAMDEDDYFDYVGGKSLNQVYKYTLSDGIYYKKSGTWTVHHDDTWYILFFNFDTDAQTTYLTYDAEFLFDWFEEYGYIAIPVGVVVFIAIAAGISKSQQQARARTQAGSRAQASAGSTPYKVQRAPAQEKREMFGEIEAKPAAPPPTPVQVKTGPPKDCELCGEKIDADAIFCPICGGKLEK